MTRWVMRSKSVGGNQISNLHNVSITKMRKALISFWFTTFVQYFLKPKHISVLHGPNCDKFQMHVGIICCTITWWSWLFMCYNLWLPTCFLNATTHLVGACILATKSTKAFASLCVKRIGLVVLCMIHPLVGKATSVASPQPLLGLCILQLCPYPQRGVSKLFLKHFSQCACHPKCSIWVTLAKATPLYH
jgi:hypothetical protein